MGKKRNRKRVQSVRAHFEQEEQLHALRSEDRKGWNSVSDSKHYIENFRKKLSGEQADYAEDIGSKKVVMSDSSAGTGKTSVAVMRGIEMLRKGSINKIIYVRFPDDRSQRLGALPGDLTEKTRGLMRPFVETLKNFGFTEEDINELVRQEVIEMATDINSRGRTIGESFTIIDEAQNGTIEDIRLMMTRLTDDGFSAVVGHSGQVDSKLKHYGPLKLNPFQVYQCHMDRKSFTALHTLTYDYRGEVSRWADKVDDTIRLITNGQNNVLFIDERPTLQLKEG